MRLAHARPRLAATATASTSTSEPATAGVRASSSLAARRRRVSVVVALRRRTPSRARVVRPLAALPEEISGLARRPGHVQRADAPANAPRGDATANARLVSSNPSNPVVSNLAAARAAAPAPPPTPNAVTVTLPASAIFALTLGSVAACGTVFMLAVAPALRAMERASVAAERAAEASEKAMLEFEKLSAQTAEDLPKTLAEMEAAGQEWDELGEELRELLARVERWGQFSGAEEALTKLTTSVLEEPTRVIDEAESYIKRLSDDFTRTLNQLSDWDKDLRSSVERAAFSEAWERQGNGEKKLLSSDADGGKGGGGREDGGKASPLLLLARQRQAVADAIAVAEAATADAQAATAELMSGGGVDADGDAIAAMEGKAESVTTALREALLAVEEAKEASRSFDDGDGDGDGDGDAARSSGLLALERELERKRDAAVERALKGSVDADGDAADAEEGDRGPNDSGDNAFVP